MVNLLPEKTKQWLGVFFSVVIAVLLYMAEWQEMSAEFHRWALRGSQLMTIVSVLFGIQITRTRPAQVKP